MSSREVPDLVEFMENFFDWLVSYEYRPLEVPPLVLNEAEARAYKEAWPTSFKVGVENGTIVVERPVTYKEVFGKEPWEGE